MYNLVSGAFVYGSSSIYFLNLHTKCTVFARLAMNIYLDSSVTDILTSNSVHMFRDRQIDLTRSQIHYNDRFGQRIRGFQVCVVDDVVFETGVTFCFAIQLFHIITL